MQHHNCGTAAIKDNKTLVTAFAFDRIVEKGEKRDLPLVASIAGTKQVVQAVRAAFAVGNPIKAEVFDSAGRRHSVAWEPTRAMYETVSANPVLQVNQHHMVIAHTALRGQMVGDHLYVMLPSDVENIPAAVLKRAEPFATIPMFPAWIPYLWERARENKLVMALPSNGLKLYKVTLDQTWAQIVKVGIEKGALKPMRECVAESEKKPNG